jgi:transmembrane sensor
MTADWNSETDILTRDASRWVTQLGSGEATAADAQALTQWRRQSPAHEAAFAEAVRVWRSLESGGRSFIAQEGLPAWPRRSHQMTRRVMLGGGGALAAAAAGFAMIDPPLGLWPSFDELRADYRTATGEQRRLTFADLTIQMNTQTSIAVPVQGDGGDGMDRVKLIAGEASFAVIPQPQRSLTVLAGAGRIVTSRARFDVRNVGTVVCVTCSDGQVQVEQGEQAVRLVAGSQLTYDDHGLGKSLAIDTAEATAWQDGFIVFRATPLPAAVAEINRYRPGKVILLNAALEKTTVSGRFRIERVDEILDWIEEAAGARARVLPGGVTLLS